MEDGPRLAQPLEHSHPLKDCEKGLQFSRIL